MQRRITVGTISLILILLLVAAVRASESTRVMLCDRVNSTVTNIGQIRVECITTDGEPSPTPEPSPSPTPIITPTPQPTPPPPDCQPHDPTVWHGYMDNPCGTIPHGHGDEPTILRQFNHFADFTQNQEISGHYQTINPMTGCTEIDCKDFAYIHLQDSAETIDDDYYCVTPDNCISGYAVEVHAGAMFSGTMAADHSYTGLLLHEDGGSFQWSGWMDCGENANLPGEIYHTGVPVGGWPSQFPYDHDGLGRFNADPDVWPRDEFWYCGNQIVRVATHATALQGQVNAIGSEQVHVIALHLLPHTIFPDAPAAEAKRAFREHFNPDNDELVNFDGFTDRFGRIVFDCVAPDDVDCNRLRIVNWPMGYTQLREIERDNSAEIPLPATIDPHQ